ncbi:MAG: molybdenum cofactor biosynthesis protein MoaE [Solirubrobacterales bacterium]|jgi:molybdopterin synthase catalytic subunit|nr:molybdenum cofactor biosynthesis protein MoaE [Solirubrobacterales bacterium]
MAFAEISETSLDLGRHLEAVSAPECGAIVTFIGQTRDHDPDVEGKVELIEYSAHPDASEILKRLANEVEVPEARLAVSHRVGTVRVGEPALIACVASAHRAFAFDLSRNLVERIKTEVPIWKRQKTHGGSHSWKGLE